MEGPRAPHEAELPRLYQFLNQSLRPQADWSIASEYPTALSKANLHNMRIITDQEKILSHAVLKPLIVRTPHVVLKVGAIGSVVTDESYRGQGLSRQIMESCLAEARAQDCDIAVLWTQLYDFYRKLGFELAGFEESFVIDRPLEDGTSKNVGGKGPPLIFKKGAQVAPEAILRVYQKHTVQTHRTAEDVRRFLQIPRARVYTAWDPQGSLEAYAVEGKGADLTNYIHEWSGSVPALFSLFNYILKDINGGTVQPSAVIRADAPKAATGSFVLIAPRHSVQLIQALNVQGIFQHEGFLGMIKIIHREQLVEKVVRAFNSVSAAAFDELSDSELTKIFFGPWDRTVKKMDGLHTDILPLRFWLWGWDSI
jgi:GNAT superfamily N-acetyltransferase